MLRIPSYDLLTFDVLKIVHQYVLAQHVDKSLNIFSHGNHVIISVCQVVKIVVRESLLKKANVKLVPTTHRVKSGSKLAPSIDLLA